MEMNQFEKKQIIKSCLCAEITASFLLYSSIFGMLILIRFI